MPKADNLPPSCAVVTKPGQRNFLEPIGSVEACNGTAFTVNIQLKFQVPRSLKKITANLPDHNSLSTAT